MRIEPTSLPALFSHTLAITVTMFVLNGCSATVSVGHRAMKPPASSDPVVTSELDRARKLTKSKPIESLDASLDAASRLEGMIRRGDTSKPTRDAYNYTVARIVETLDTASINPWSSTASIPGKNTNWQLKARLSHSLPGVNPLNYRLIPTDTVTIGGTYFQNQYRTDGIGAPVAVVARTGTSRTTVHDLNRSAVYGTATVTVSFRGSTADLVVHERLKDETVALGGRTHTLSADFSTPIAMMVRNSGVEKLGLVRLISPQRYDDTTRITELQVYDPERIPLLLVHGLDSTPATWTPLINALRADPEMRKRYQIWVFSYPSGYPYSYSATLLRRQIKQMQVRHPGHKPMVIVGHSMGGMISRLMITDSGESIWRSYFPHSPSQTKLPGAHRKLLEETFVFDHEEKISRAIFASTPHRGSNISITSFGRMFSRLVRVPTFLADMKDSVLTVMTVDATALTLERAPNSIDTLAPNNRFVRAVDKLPIVPGIPYHSVIGDRGKGGNKDHTAPVMSDGVVPYWSAHFNGSVSEKIIPSNHSSHQHPEGIDEIHRILRLHAGVPGRSPATRSAVKKAAAQSAPTLTPDP